MSVTLQQIDFAGSAVATTLTGSSMTAVSPPNAGTFSIANAAGWPDGSAGKFTVVIDRGTANEEKILCSSRTALTVTVDATAGRGYDGTVATTHTSGTATVEHCIDATVLQKIIDALCLLTAKGDLLVATASRVLERMAAGADNAFLVYDSTTATGFKTINYGAIGGNGNANANGVANTPARSDHAHKRDVRVAKAGVDVGTRNRINLVVDPGIDWTITDDAGNDEIDIVASLRSREFVGYQTAGLFSVANDTNTAIPLTGEVLDTDTFHDNAVNNTRVTIPAGLGGRYLVIGRLSWNTNGTGYRSATIVKNGSVTNTLAQATQPGMASQGTVVNVAEVVTLAAGDYIELWGKQNSGGALDVIGDNTTFKNAISGLTVRYLGP